MSAPTFPVKVHARTGELRELALLRGDFAALKRIAGQTLEIKHIEREFRRLQSRGLAGHTVRNDDAGFPHAFAELTAAGHEALTQIPAALAGQV